jgi:hypothetical protein
MIPDDLNLFGEDVSKAIDQDIYTKYLNFIKLNTGFQATPQYCPSVISVISMTTANDFPGRDPKNW